MKIAYWEVYSKQVKIISPQDSKRWLIEQVVGETMFDIMF